MLSDGVVPEGNDEGVETSLSHRRIQATSDPSTQKADSPSESAFFAQEDMRLGLRMTVRLGLGGPYVLGSG